VPQQTYLKAKMPVGEAGHYTITLDYNGLGKVATKKLYDVDVKHGCVFGDWDFWEKRSRTVHN